MDRLASQSHTLKIVLYASSSNEGCLVMLDQTIEHRPQSRCQTLCDQLPKAINKANGVVVSNLLRLVLLQQHHVRVIEQVEGVFGLRS